VNVNRLFHWRKLYQRGRLAKQETRTMSLLAVRGQKVCKPDYFIHWLAVLRLSTSSVQTIGGVFGES
jgi:hypothetical protein